MQYFCETVPSVVRRTWFVYVIDGCWVFSVCTSLGQSVGLSQGEEPRQAVLYDSCFGHICKRPGHDA